MEIRTQLGCGRRSVNVVRFRTGNYIVADADAEGVLAFRKQEPSPVVAYAKGTDQ